MVITWLALKGDGALQRKTKLLVFLLYKADLKAPISPLLSSKEKKKEKRKGSSSDLSNSFVPFTYFVLKCAVSVAPDWSVKVVS
jgi:hypothetical protein